jgi:hypothetical protein
MHGVPQVTTGNVFSITQNERKIMLTEAVTKFLAELKESK